MLVYSYVEFFYDTVSPCFIGKEVPCAAGDARRDRDSTSICTYDYVRTVAWRACVRPSIAINVALRTEGVTRKACRRPVCPVSERKITMFSSLKTEHSKNSSANEASATSGPLKKSGGRFTGKEVHPVVGDRNALRRMNLLTTEYEYSSRYEFPYSKN